MSKYSKHLLVCGGTACKSHESDHISEKLKKELSKQGLEDTVQVIMTGCFGFCDKGPIVKVMPDNTFYTQVRPEDAEEIIEEHIVKGQRVERLLQTDFKKKQLRIALRNCGLINPELIDEYIARDGYGALGEVLSNKTPEEVIAVMKSSGLRGRGGAGFPAGLKWDFARKNEADQKYVVCNADEGDPGAFMDRSILEGDPHSVLGYGHSSLLHRGRYGIYIHQGRIPPGH